MNRPRTRFDQKEWRLSHVYEIVNKDGNRCTMTPNIVQMRLIGSKSLRKLILKARQMGVSTFCLLNQYDNAITNPNTTAAIIAHEQDAIRKLFRIPQRAHKYTHDFLKPEIDRGGGSQYEMFFPKINSRIYCDLEIRGDTIHDLHISEMAFIKDQDKVKASLQAVPITSGRVSIESTANGIGGLFYDMWHDPDQPFEKFFFPWFIFPEYALETDPIQLTDEEKDFVKKAKAHFGMEIRAAQIAFRRYKQRELKDMFLQEYPEDDQQCFLSSGHAAMDLFILKELVDQARQPTFNDGRTLLYAPYNNGHLYACGVDTAEGVGGDASAACMFDVNTREQVGVMAHNRMKPYDYAHALFRFCERFMEPGRPFPLLGVERNNHGHAVLLELEENIGYTNLFHRPISEGNDERPGWVTDRVTRPLMIDCFIDGVEHRSVKLNDRGTLSECMTLVNNEGKIEASEGKHDDRVIAGAIGVQMVVASGVSALYDNISGKILL